MARPVGIRPAQSFRGPLNKLIWTCEDQKRAIQIGFFVGRRVEIEDHGFGKQKFERAAINRILLGKLTKPMFLNLFNDGLGARDPFWLKLQAFINQQTQWGYVGCWEERALTFGGMRLYQGNEQIKRLRRMHPQTRDKAQAEAFRREFGRNVEIDRRA